MPENDAALVAALRRGDRRAFGDAYARHKDRIYAFLLRMSGRRDVADDVFQETFLKLARFARLLREDTDLAAWLFAVARNAYRSHRRWAALDISRFLVLAQLGTIAEEEPQPDALAEGAQAARRLEAALGRLAPASREALLLTGVEGFEQDRAAEIVGISYAAFRKRLSRARAELQTEMDRQARRPGAKEPDAVPR